MKEQPRRPKEQYSLDLSYDDDFFDLPPYEPHAEEPDKQQKEHVSLRDTARSTVSALRGIHWRRHLITPILSLIVTAIVVLIAYGAATTTPPDDTAFPLFCVGYGSIVTPLPPLPPNSVHVVHVPIGVGNEPPFMVLQRR